MTEYSKEVQDLLDELWYPEAQESFMARQMPVFDGKSGNQLIEEGSSDIVVNYLTTLAKWIMF